VQQLGGTKLNTIYDAISASGTNYTQWVDSPSCPTSIGKYGSWYGRLSTLIGSHTFAYRGSVAFSSFEKSVQAENASLDHSHLYAVNFIDSDPLEDVNAEDEHPPGIPQRGQAFVYDVVRVLMSNPNVWNHSALFITWDENGGFYDHVDPPHACTPDNLDPNFAGGAYGTTPPGDGTDIKYGGHFDRFGIRVPLLVVSPFAKPHYVSHGTYDHTSIDRFIEAWLGLPALTRRDANADPLLDFFDFSQPPNTPNLAGPYPNTPSKPAAGPAPEPSFAGPGDVNLALAPAACTTLFPPAQFLPQNACGAGLGANVYDAYAYSPGIPAPAGYDSQVSAAFPLFIGDGGAAETCCIAAGGSCGADAGTCCSNLYCSTDFVCRPSQTVDGGVCDQKTDQTIVGNDQPLTQAFDLGKSPSTFTFNWNTYSIPDQIIVTHDGATLFDTGCTGGDGTAPNTAPGGTQPLSITGGSTTITVTVVPDCTGEHDTVWDFTVGCAQ
jgi:hypothetical protein